MAGKSSKGRNRKVSNAAAAAAAAAANSLEQVEVPANPSTGKDERLEQVPVTNDDSAAAAKPEAKIEPENDNSAAQAKQGKEKIGGFQLVASLSFVRVVLE